MSAGPGFSVFVAGGEMGRDRDMVCNGLLEVSKWVTEV